ncbi:MAG TPA: glycoside hydrolase family 15 protein [Acidimicrobiales bacterium]|nr:glycoside hydrolase family 15 protein [Acidimicrobiales bacterium]
MSSVEPLRLPPEWDTSAHHPQALRGYTFLADGSRGAVLDPDGGVAWLCFPTFSDGAVFAGLLGGRGTFQLAPSARHVTGGYYEDGSLIWHQRWVTDDGIVESCDALAYPGETDRCVVLRRIRAFDRDSSIRCALEVAPDYGRRPGGSWRSEADGWRLDTEGLTARLTGAVARARSSDSVLDLELRVAAGSTCDFVLELQTASRGLPRPPDPDRLWQRTRAAWADAVPRCTEIPAQRDVRQSIAVLRGMTDPSGASVAAATTALPERAEAGRNYDYRFAWLRDVAYIGRAGAAVPDAEIMLSDAVRWVSARLLEDGPETRPAYRGDGRPVPHPEHLGLPGYPGGSDVIGNRASQQFQLDLFGEALLIFALAAERDLLDADGWRAAEIALRAIEANADTPEAGIWEIEPGRLWTHSRLICVAGLKAIVEQSAPVRWRTRALGLADHLLSRADSTCLHPSGHWQRAPDDPRVDASLLLSEVRGALPPSDSRSVATRAAILRDLCDDDFLYRFADEGEPLGQAEGAFLVCNFWMALAYLGDGDATRGSQWFERTRASCGGSGLFSEEYDVSQRQLRGNLPQAFVHALLIETAGRLRDV